MSDTGRFSETTGGKVIAAVVTALTIGAVTQSILLYSSSQVTNQKLESLSVVIAELKSDLKDLRSQGRDRWKKSDHVAYAADQSIRFGKIWDAVAAIRDEQAKRTGNVYKVEQLARELELLRAKVRKLDK